MNTKWRDNYLGLVLVLSPRYFTVHDNYPCVIMTALQKNKQTNHLKRQPIVKCVCPNIEQTLLSNYILEYHNYM